MKSTQAGHSDYSLVFWLLYGGAGVLGTICVAGGVWLLRFAARGLL